MGNVSSSIRPTVVEESCMPGGFPGDQSLHLLTRDPRSQGAKRKRNTRSSNDENLPSGQLTPPKKVRAKPAYPDETDQEHCLAPAAPVLSIRAPEAPKTSDEPLRDYERLRKLGESSEGKVYLMKSKKTAELLAVKMIKKKKTYDVAHLPEDCTLHLNLPIHPHIIFMSRADIVDGEIWQGLELCNGSDLISFMERVDRYTLQERGRMAFVVHVLIQLGEAFAFLHHGLRRVHKGKWETDPGWSASTHAIIWGDTKPENILLSFSPANEYGLLPDIRLSDSGHATLASTPWQTAGSPLYFCPEVQAAVRGQKAPLMSTQSDIYAMGLTLYLLITGKHWKTGADPKFMKLPTEYHDIGFTRLLTYCLQVNPKHRPSMNCHLGSGLIPAIDQAWDARDDLVRKCKSCDTDFWVAWRKEACKKV